MARNKATQQNIDGSDLFNYPDKRIRNNDGSGNGTPVDESVYGDIHEFFAKVMRDSKTPFNGVPDNTTNGYQLYDSFMMLAGKNDLIQNIFSPAIDTVSLPIPLGSLKSNETLQFKSTFDSTVSMIITKGSDNASKPLMILGSFKSGQMVRAVNNQNYISLTGLYDAQVLPDLIQTITTIQTTFASLTKFLSVFSPGGGMVLWNKPANQIPNGWAEVVDWRGRLPTGWNPAETEFDYVGKNGGSKDRLITKQNLPNITLKYTNTRQGNPDNGRGGYNGGNNHMTDTEFQTEPLGSGVPLNILGPYRTVVFIEFVG